MRSPDDGTMISLSTPDLAIYISELRRLIESDRCTSDRKTMLTERIRPLEEEMSMRIAEAVQFLEGPSE